MINMVEIIVYLDKSWYSHLQDVADHSQKTQERYIYNVVIDWVNKLLPTYLQLTVNGSIDMNGINITKAEVDAFNIVTSDIQVDDKLEQVKVIFGPKLMDKLTLMIKMVSVINLKIDSKGAFINAIDKFIVTVVKGDIMNELNKIDAEELEAEMDVVLKKEK